MCVACWAFNLRIGTVKMSIIIIRLRRVIKKRFIFGEEVIYMYANIYTIEEA